jgi:hypothetical protein
MDISCDTTHPHNVILHCENACLTKFCIRISSFYFNKNYPSQVLLGRSDVSGWGAFLKVKLFL